MVISMEIQRYGIRPQESQTGDIFFCVIEECNDPDRFLCLFTEKVWDIIKEDMTKHNFHNLWWRRKPEYIEEESFETKTKKTLFRARVGYSKNIDIFSQADPKDMIIIKKYEDYENESE